MGVGALQLFHVMRFSVLILIGVILVKSGYSLDEIGSYELFFFLANVVSFFWAMGLNNALMSFYPTLDKERKSTLIFNLGFLLVGLGVMAGGLLYLFWPEISFLLGSEGELPYLSYIIIYILLSAPGNFTEYIYLLRRQPANIKRYGIILFSLQLILMAIGVLLGLGIEGLLVLMVLWAAVKFIWFSVEVIKGGHFKLDFRLAGQFFMFSLPLIIHMMLGNGMEYVDGFLVNHFFDEAAFAQFRYGARELPLVTVLIGAISTALIPVAVKKMDKALIDVKRRIEKMMNLLFPLSIILMLVSPFAFPLFYSNDFAVSAQIFNVYLLIISSRILMPQVVLFARHENNILMVSAFIELIVNILLSLLLLRSFGMVGIAWATVIAFAINKLILMLFAWKKHRIAPSQYLNIELYTTWLSILAISYYISTFYH